MFFYKGVALLNKLGDLFLNRGASGGILLDISFAFFCGHFLHCSRKGVGRNGFKIKVIFGGGVYEVGARVAIDFGVGFCCDALERCAFVQLLNGDVVGGLGFAGGATFLAVPDVGVVQFDVEVLDFVIVGAGDVDDGLVLVDINASALS